MSVFLKEHQKPNFRNCFFFFCSQASSKTYFDIINFFMSVDCIQHEERYPSCRFYGSRVLERKNDVRVVWPEFWNNIRKRAYLGGLLRKHNAGRLGKVKKLNISTSHGQINDIYTL